MLLVVEEQRRIEELLPLGQNLVGFGPVVRLGREVKGRHLRHARLGLHLLAGQGDSSAARR